MATRFKPTITIVAGKLSNGKKPIEFHCWCSPEDRETFERMEWGGEFSCDSQIAPTVDPISVTTSEGERVNIFITESSFESRMEGPALASCRFQGIGDPPAELYVRPKRPEPKPAKVRLVLARHHVNQPAESFDSIREALLVVKCAVDDNTAAPVWMEVPSTLIGSGPAQFDTHQIYAMLNLIDD